MNIRNGSIIKNLYLFISLLQLQCLRRLVAYFRRTEVLDRTRIYIACVLGPYTAERSKFLERSAILFHQCRLDNWFHLAMATFHVHHHRHRDTACNPLVSRSCRIAY